MPKPARKPSPRPSIDPRIRFVARWIAPAIIPPAAWYWVTLQTPGWPVQYVAAGLIVALIAAAFTYGGEPKRALVAVPFAAAILATTTWFMLNAFTNPPVLWAHRGGIAVASMWAVGVTIASAMRTRTAPATKGKKGDPLRAALASTGVAKLAAPPESERDPVRVGKPKKEGDGQTYVVELPPGVSVAELAGRADRVAGALSRRTEDITVEVGAHQSQAVIWVGEKGAGAKQAGPWPHTKDTSPRSALDPIDIGLDKRGNPVTLPLHGGSGVLLGALPRKGKSSLMNLIIASVLSDPRARAWFLDFKGGADFTAWQPAAERFHAGPPDMDPDTVMSILESFYDDMMTKYKALPEHRAEKIDERIASLPGMGPTVIVIDEAQQLLAAKSGMKKEDRDRAIAIITSIIGLGGAVNSWLLIASQRVTEDQIPASITGRVTTRVAFRLGSQPASQAVLGPDAWAQGYRATDLQTPGIGFIATDDGVGHLRAWRVSTPEAYEIAERISGSRRVPQDAVGESPGRRVWVRSTPVKSVSLDAPTTAFTAADTAVLRAVEHGRPPEGWHTEGLRDARNRKAIRDQEAELRKIEAAEAAELEARTKSEQPAPSAAIPDASIAHLLGELDAVWPRYSDGGRRVGITWDDLAEAGLEAQVRALGLPSAPVRNGDTVSRGVRWADVESKLSSK